MATPTQTEHWRTWVEAAQGGDRAAFELVVQRFQDLAMGRAVAWLGDAELARDVTQETFIEVHLRLHQLRDVQAFPGWLHKIVTKHCDRVTRRTSPITSSTDEPFANANWLDEGPSSATLERGLITEQTAQRLHLAVEALPANQRSLVVLHYFSEASGPELAEFLELPLTTIKQRLRKARKALRDQGDSLVEQTLRTRMSRLRPSQDHKFSQEVQFFIALRAGEHKQVQQLLTQSPDLTNALQTWDASLTYAGILPFANRATALLTCIELDDLDMAQLLLDAGADPNADCHCDAGETPLWAATLFNRPGMVRLLLERGASPDTASANGTRPVHVAAMRGYDDIYDLLVQAGADPAATDKGPIYPNPGLPPRTADQWANQKKILAHESSTGSGTIWHTGIRSIDLFAPIPQGGIVRVPFRAGVGMMVLLGELIHHMLARKGAAIWSGFAQPPFDVVDWEAEMSELGLQEKVERHFASFNDTATTRSMAFTAGIARAEALCAAGTDVMLVVTATQGFEADIDQALLRIKREQVTKAQGSITTFLITPFEKTEDDIWANPPAPFDAQLLLSRKLAKAHIFPALDPLLSTSTLPGDPELNRLAILAREHIRSSAANDAQYPSIELLHYLRQPFYVTQAFTGSPGETTPMEPLIAQLQRQLA